MLVSVVIPTLNEEKTIGECIKRAKEALRGKEYEIIVADNSTDRTPEIASSLGAKVITPDKNGYGYAYLAGLSVSSGKYIVIADGDGTYDLSDIPRFLEPLMKGEADFVIGSRLKGEIKPGAMPWHHRRIGNPLLTRMLNWLFKMKISDAHCGMRAFTREALERMELRTHGMEFASEMVIEAGRKELRMKEIPITYYQRKTQSKLHSFTDGWRHFRFMMLYKPLPFLIIPGLILFLFGLTMTVVLAIKGDVVLQRLHSFIFGGVLTIMGYQTLITGLYTQAYGVIRGILEAKGFIKNYLEYHFLEIGLLIGTALLIVGIALGIRILHKWISIGYGVLAEVEMAVASLIIASLGIQTIFSSLFTSMLLIERE